MPTPVLIFSSSSGGAHEAAAQAVAEELQHPPAPPVAVADVHAFLSGLERSFYRRGQFVFMNTGAPFTRALVRRGQESPLLAGLVHRRYPLAQRRLRALFAATAPAAVLSTHPLGVVAAARCPEAEGLPLLFVPVNYEGHRLQVHPRVTRYCVAHSLVAEDFRALGVPAAALAVTGMPLPRRFDDLPAVVTARAALGLPKTSPLVLVSQGAMGSGPWTVRLVSTLLRALPADTNLVVLTGYQRVTPRLLALRHFPPRLRQIAFTADFPLYLRAADLLIGKAGGLTSSAAFVTGTPLLLLAPNPMEVVSAERFVAAGAAVSAGRSVPEAVRLASLLLASPARRAALVAAARRFVVRGGRQEIAGLVREILTARAGASVPA